MSTSIPPITIDNTGSVVPDAADVLTGVLADLNDSWGGDLDITSTSTPHYYFAQNETESIVAQNAIIAYMINQFNVSNAEGRFQDALAWLYFIERKSSTASTVTATLSGTTGVTIASGVAIARDDAGNYWSNNDEFTFVDGLASVEFACQTTGAISLGIAQLTTISTAISGWDTITNESTAVVGSATETQAALEQRRIESVAGNSVGNNDSLMGALWDLDGVTDVYVDDNPSNVTVEKGATSYSFPPHSVYICVQGGVDSDIGKVILNKKNTGATPLGNTEVVVVNESSYLVPPYPIKTYNFNRATSTDLYFIVNIKSNTLIPSSATESIKAAIVQTFNGNDGINTKARIGGYVFSSYYYANIMTISRYIAIIDIFVGKSASPTETQITMGIDEIPVLSSSNITVNFV